MRQHETLRCEQRHLLAELSEHCLLAVLPGQTSFTAGPLHLDPVYLNHRTVLLVADHRRLHDLAECCFLRQCKKMTYYASCIYVGYFSAE